MEKKSQNTSDKEQKLQLHFKTLKFKVFISDHFDYYCGLQLMKAPKYNFIENFQY